MAARVAEQIHEQVLDAATRGDLILLRRRVFHVFGAVRTAQLASVLTSSTAPSSAEDWVHSQMKTYASGSVITGNNRHVRQESIKRRQTHPADEDADDDAYVSSVPAAASQESMENVDDDGDDGADHDCDDTSTGETLYLPCQILVPYMERNLT